MEIEWIVINKDGSIKTFTDIDYLVDYIRDFGIDIQSVQHVKKGD